MGMREDFEKWADANWMIVHSPEDAWECWQAATLQAAERMKEEAAKVCNTGAKDFAHNRIWVAAYGSFECEKAIRAIDVNKLFGE